MIGVVQTEPMRPDVERQLNERYAVHKLWEAGDHGAFLAGPAGACLAIAAAGHTPVDAGLLERLPALQIIASFGVGYDHIDATAAAARGVVVTNTPDVLTDEVADLALGLLIATVRRLPQAERYLRDGLWPHGPFPLTGSLRGRRAGIFGLGRIGRAIAPRLAAFGVPVAYHGRRRQDDVGLPYFPTLLGLAAKVDILISAAPGGEETRGVINAAVLQALGPDGVLINVGRGSVVDEPALAAALHGGTIAAAGLDVFSDEPNVPEALLQAPNAVLLPHVASGSVRTRDAMGQLVVDNLHAWFSHQGALTPVAECLALLARGPGRPG